MKNAGVYVITNLYNNKKYVGSSLNVYSRVHNHKSYLKNGRHLIKDMQADYSAKPGFFTSKQVWTLEGDYSPEIAKVLLTNKELEFINELETYNPQKGYNKICPVTGVNLRVLNMCGGDYFFDKYKEYFIEDSERNLSSLKEYLKDALVVNLITRKGKFEGLKVRKKGGIDKVTFPFHVGKFQPKLSADFTIYQIENNTSNVLREFQNITEIKAHFPELKDHVKILERVIYNTQLREDGRKMFISVKGILLVRSDFYTPGTIYKKGRIGNPNATRLINPNYRPERGYKTYTAGKTLYVTDNLTGEVTTYSSIKEFITQYPEHTRKGIEKVLYGDKKSYKGKTFKYEINRIPYE